MIYSSKEILKKYKTRYNLSNAIKNKEIFKLEHGIYSDRELVNPMIIASKKYPNAIVTMDSAFNYYDLTDVIPNKTFVATNRNSNTIKNENIVQVWVPKEILNQGKEKVIVCDGTGNINIISRTTNFILPSFDIFKLDKISSYYEKVQSRDIVR